MACDCPYCATCPEYPGDPAKAIPVGSVVGEEAVRRVQREAGLLVDGILGPQTWAAMFAPVI